VTGVGARAGLELELEPELERQGDGAIWVGTHDVGKRGPPGRANRRDEQGRAGQGRAWQALATMQMRMPVLR
jgi:hypothetical protein